MEQQQQHDEALEQLSALDEAENPTIEPEPESQEHAQEDGEQPLNGEDCEAVAGMLEAAMIGGELWISSAVDAPFEWDKEHLRNFVDKSQPLIAKHGHKWLSVAAKYQAEIMFAAAAFGLSMSAMKQIKVIRTEQAAKMQNDIEQGVESEKAREASQSAEGDEYATA